MDYDARINRLEDAIQLMEATTEVQITDSPTSITSEDWNNSKSKEAAEAFREEMDEFLTEYKEKFETLLSKLRSMKTAVHFEKMASFRIHKIALISLPEDAQEQYMSKKQVDSSVKEMLKDGGYV